MPPSESSEAEAMKTKIETGVIYCEDNLAVMKHLESGSIDFIYIDPPFCTQKDYGVIWGDKEDRRSFSDRWSGGIYYFERWMADRLEEMYRLLTPNGVLCVHLDFHASHYIKVALDKIFGQGTSRPADNGSRHLINEIIWRRSNGGGAGSKARKLSVVTDTILVYAKSKNYHFGDFFIDDRQNPPESIKKAYSRDDHDGRGPYQLISMQKPGDNPSPNQIYEFHGVKPSKRGWKWVKARTEKAYREGRIVITKNKRLRYKKYLSEREGMPLNNLWTDISCVQGKSKQEEGWRTQKPVELVERLIRIFTKKDAVVADFFCGCGTTLEAAHRLNRRWIGVDQSPKAANVIRQRLERLNIPYKELSLMNLTKREVLDLDHFEFEKYCVRAIGGIPNDKQVGDHGIDGRLKIDGTPIQVKKSKRVGRTVIDKFYRHAKEKGSGIIIALSFAPTAYEQVAILKKEGIDLKLITIDDLKKRANADEIQILERATRKSATSKKAA